MALNFLNNGYFAGKVGIGTESPNEKLEVNGAVAIGNATDGIKLRLTGTVGEILGLSTTSGSWNDLDIRTQAATQLYLKTDGNVGIGTTSPRGKLEVEVPTGTGIDADEHVLISDGVATNPQQMRLGVNTASNYSYIQSAHEFIAYAPLILNPKAGNVGIGTTSPDTRLEVEVDDGTAITRTTMSAADGYRGGFEASNTHTGGSIWSMFSTNDSDGYFGGGKFVIANETMGDVDASTPALVVVNGAGNVGIGTTEPSSLLTLNKATGEVGILLEGNGTDVAKFKLSSAGVNHAVQIGSVSNNEVQFHTVNSEKMRITPTGDVGIGTTIPNSKLTVWDVGQTFDARTSGINVHRPNSYGQYGSFSYDGGTTHFASTYTGNGALNYGAFVFKQYNNGTVGRNALEILSDGNFIFNQYAGSALTGTPTYLLGTDASGNVVKTNTVPGSAAGPYLPLAGGTMTGTTGVTMPDSFPLFLGSSGINDSQIYWDGDNIEIQARKANADIVFRAANSSSVLGEFLAIDGGVQKTRAYKDIHFGYNVKATFGDTTSPDLQIYHDGSNSYINETGTGNLYLKSASSLVLSNITSGSVWIECINNQVELKNAGSTKLTTTSTGVTVTGALSVGTSGTSRFTDTSAFPLQLNRGLAVDVHGTNGVALGLGSYSTGTTYVDAARIAANLESATSGDLFLQVNNSGTYTNALTINNDTNATFAGNITASTGLVTSQTAHFTDNVYLSGGQLYFGASGSSTDDTYRMYASSGQFILASRESGTWTTRFDIDTSGNATFSTQAFATTATSSGDASSTLTTKGYVDSLITGATIYRGTWDPDVSLNSGYGNPNLSGVTQTSGYYYICSADGAATPNNTGNEPDSWEVGDWVVWNDDAPIVPGGGTGAWQKIDNTSVLSGIGTGSTVALWEGASSVTDSETLGNSIMTQSGTRITTTGSTTATAEVRGGSFYDGYITWTAAQINRYGSAIELQFAPTNSATEVKIGANGSNPTIFNAYTGDAQFAGSATFISAAASGAALVTIENNSGSTATSYGLLVIGGGNSSNGRTFEVRDASGNTDFIITGDGYSQFNGVVETANGVRNANGTEANPSYTFASDIDLGMYRIGANSLGFSTGGDNRLTIDSSGGSTFTGLVSGITPTAAANFTTKNYVDTTTAGYRNLTFVDGTEKTDRSTSLPAPNRTSNPDPEDYSRVFSTEFKNSPNIGTPVGNAWAGLISMAPYNTGTSFITTQIAFAASGSNTDLYKRQGSGTTWGSWDKFLTEGNSGTGPFLPLTAGSSYPLTGDLIIDTKIRFGVYSYIGEDLTETDSLTIASDSTESIFFAHYNQAAATYTTTAEIDSDGNFIIGNVAYGSSLGQVRIINDAASAPASLSLFGYNNIADGGNYASIDLAMQSSGTAGNVVASIRGLAEGTGENASDLAFYTATGGTLSERMRIDSSGNVGIGVTAVTEPGFWYDATNKYLAISHWATPPTPAALLHLSDNANDIDVPQIRIEGRENPGDTKLDISVTDPNARFNLQENTGDANAGYGLMIFKTNAVANSTNPTRGGFNFQTPAATSSLFITNEANVGIGTDSPGAKLDVRKGGTTAAQGDTDLIVQDSTAASSTAQVQILGGATGYSNLYFSDTAAYNVGGFIYNHTDNYLATNVNGSEKMRIDSSGNVGIGVTPWVSTLPNTIIDINPVASIWGYANSVYLNSNAYYNSGWLYKSTAAAGVLQVDGDILRFRAAASGTADAGIAFDVPFIVDSGGNVGIGTTTPQKKVHIEGTGGASEMQILVSSASDTVGHTAGIGLRGEGGEADGDLRIKGGIFFERIAGSFGNGKMILAVNSSVSNTSVTVADHALTIDTNKNVGIGITGPQSKLQVAGGIQMADDTDTAVVGKVGTLRYRTSGNNSYVDMCMQTAASTYAWINIVQNNW